MNINRKNLLLSALRSPDPVSAGAWSAQRHRGRPHCVLVYNGTKVIMEVDCLHKRVTALSTKPLTPHDRGSVTVILQGAGIDQSYVPARKEAD
jgi:hypothetical protein